MKKSEQLRKEAQSIESDIAYLGAANKIMREEREERFIERYYSSLEEKLGMAKVDPVQRGYLWDTEKFGRIIFFPKANKVLLCKQNKWVKPGLQWLIKNFELK